ncbi:Fic family protein [Curtobacterium sp. MCJR17_055]|uniref:Fic family protein n=1 Tax=unclassified Curtobacterium TaxID=257496 RepID=UPI000D9C2A06|nr:MULTISPECIES: Fic family protein [unclassified Curtobacterium]PYY38065.1 Fic family protein [Curtobacterium sp. MCBD17_029]PYY57090.1 Fic family protein [Curtobacterium sp. MCJR17_055]PYY61994.1 Fic family protein [Curtobacterium sp. MCPF17_015]
MGWPAIGSEELWFESRYASFGIAASRRSTTGHPYRAAVPPLIADLDPVVPSATAAIVDDATEALVRFDAGLGGEIAAFAPLLLRSEAAASSQIEHLTASARAIFTAELGDSSRQNAAQIVANTRAMQAALELAADLTPETVLAMHAALLEGDPHHDAGTWRDEPVWIGRAADSPRGADFVAPRADRVPGLVDDVMRFARRSDLPRLVQVAVTHAQFETIHPFTDGNGRTGRALMQAMFRGTGLTRNVTIPVSAGLLTDTAGYHAALDAYRAGDVAAIVTATAEACFRAVDNATVLVADVHAVRERWRDTVRSRSDSAVWRVLEVVARQPVVTAATLGVELGPSVNVYRALDTLTSAGVLQAKSEYSLRSRVYRSDDVLQALDAFAARAGRRG